MIFERPWGTYEILLEEPNYKVKRIVINPNQKFSLQYHNNRSEYWTVVEGSGTMTIDGPQSMLEYLALFGIFLVEYLIEHLLAKMV